MAEAHEIQRAMDLHREGKLREASEAYERIVAEHPDNARIWAALAQIWSARLLFGRAVECMEKAIAAAPQEFIFSYLLAAPLRRLGRYEECAAALARSVGMRADHWESHLELIWVLERLGRSEEALEARLAFEAALPSEPAALDAHAEELATNRKRPALACLERATALDGSDAGRWVRLGNLHRELGQHEPALSSFQKAVEIDPQAAGAHAGLVWACERLDMREDARWYAATALAQNPDDMELQFALARLDRQDGDLKSAVGRLRRLKADPRIDSKWTYAGVCIELGLTLDAGGDSDRAFASVAEGQAVLRERKAARRVPAGGLLAWIRHVRAGTEALDPSVWASGARASGVEDVSADPVFVVGFPGSGVGSVERMLLDTSEFRSGRGAPLLAETIREMRQVSKTEASYPEILGELDAEMIAALRASYIAGSEGAGAAGGDAAGRVLDAVEMNITRLGAIARVFPGAKVVHVVRDPRDCCLECVFSMHEANPTTIHFFDLDAATALYERVMDLYIASRDRLGLDLAEVRVEDLAREPEAIRSRIVEFVGVGLGGDVPKPMASRWKRYAFRLEPFGARLSRFVEEFGYSG